MTRTFDVIGGRAGPAGAPSSCPGSRRVASIVRGVARLDGELRVRVGDELLEAREAMIVATGSTAFMPPIRGLADAARGRAATSRRRAEVTIVEARERLLSREEPFAGEQVAAALAALGIGAWRPIARRGRPAPAHRGLGLVGATSYGL